jgi:hypothetical protein
VKWLAALFVLSLLLSPDSARADVQRFAVLVGNNLGQSDDAPLRYAEADANKVQAVLRDLGGFVPANVVVLRNENANTVRSTLITLNDRIRTAAAVPGTQTLLFVYYSGHADASALHLGASRLDTFELAQLVRGSSATFRLLVVDACRSGTLTRVKGGRIVAPFALPGQRGLGGEGLAFLTASSANEDAQESDELKGSFFTHALVSGLLGAADVDRDGTVTLEEAYRHAYGATLRATSRTWAGAQHPTFQYDFRGQDALVLTRLASAAAERATLAFPPDIAFLVLQANDEGPVIGEVGQGDRARSLSLRPGRYFLRGRGRDVLLEGEVTLAAGETRTVDPGALRRMEYARLVRKGERESKVAHGPELGATVHSSLSGAETPCVGIVGGYRVELEHLTFDGRLGGCFSRFDNGVVRATTDELDASVAALHAWDLPWITLALGVGVGGMVTFQSFETEGTAPSRQSISPYVLAAGSATVDLPSGYFVSLDARGETHFLDLQESSEKSSDVKPAVALRLALLGGLLF